MNGRGRRKRIPFFIFIGVLAVRTFLFRLPHIGEYIVDFFLESVMHIVCLLFHGHEELLTVIVCLAVWFLLLSIPVAALLGGLAAFVIFVVRLYFSYSASMEETAHFAEARYAKALKRSQRSDV